MRLVDIVWLCQLHSILSLVAAVILDCLVLDRQVSLYRPFVLTAFSVISSSTPAVCRQGAFSSNRTPVNDVQPAKPQERMTSDRTIYEQARGTIFSFPTFFPTGTQHMDPADIPSPYGYTPTRYVAIVFLVLFCVSTLTHIRYATRTPLLCTSLILCGILEIMGWSARLVSSISPSKIIPYELQLVVTLTGPTLIAQPTLSLLSSLLENLSDVSSEVRLRTFVCLPLSASISGISFMLQTYGAALAGVAIRKGKRPNVGRRLMLAGTSIHFAAVLIHLIWMLATFIRDSKRGKGDLPIAAIVRNRRVADAEQNSDEKLAVRQGFDFRSTYAWIVVWLLVNIACILTRLGYRLAELSGGFGGRIMTTERYFNVLDAAMVLVVMVICNVAFPGCVRYLERFGNKRTIWLG
ncbi:RTA1 like protein-domain-containing protein [Lyophyllum atratum]|nr:RTA1 like protein-domain-containing protein [Lyophyllum atratum]